MKIQFKTDNAAFEYDKSEISYKEEEISRILCKIARQVESGNTRGLVIDINGNRIGEWEI